MTDAAASELGNLSVRADVQTDDNILIDGIILRGGNPKRVGKIEVGAGAAVTVGPVVSPVVSDLLRETAEAEGIGHCIEVYSDRTQTDADVVHVSRGGVPTGLVSIPVRYMHSPVEVCSLDDLEAVISLVAAFARRLDRETSFLR